MQNPYVTLLENRMTALDNFIETLTPFTWAERYWKGVRYHIFKLWMREVNKR